MQVTKNFDVKISVVHPYLTRNISEKDSERISRNTLFKYEPQKAIETPQLASQSVADEEESSADVAAKLIQRFKDIYDGFDTLREKAANRLSDIVYEYDVTVLENEAIAVAEESIFGAATGTITFKKYKQAIELSELIEEEIRRRATLQGAASVA